MHLASGEGGGRGGGGGGGGGGGEGEGEGGRRVLGGRLTGMCRACQGGADSCFPPLLFRSPDKVAKTSNSDRRDTTPAEKQGYSAAGNCTRVFRVTGGNTNHYTTADVREARGC